jgi:hypothetical protein
MAMARDCNGNVHAGEFGLDRAEGA